jgi:hypothetical protein
MSEKIDAERTIQTHRTHRTQFLKMYLTSKMQVVMQKHFEDRKVACVEAWTSICNDAKAAGVIPPLPSTWEECRDEDVALLPPMLALRASFVFEDVKTLAREWEVILPQQVSDGR